MGGEKGGEGWGEERGEGSRVEKGKKKKAMGMREVEDEVVC